jgi:hypothetical protein
MKTHGARANIAHREWSLEVGSDGVLVFRLSGSWLMHDHLPPRAVIEHELGARPTARVLAFDTRSVDDWDSGFVVFVRHVLDVGRGLRLGADLSGLPAGVRKLLDLAAAVPERETGRGARPVPLLAGRWELFERSGSITTAVGLAVASRRYIRYGALELALLETGKRERDTVDILTDMATGKLGLALSAFGTVIWGWGEYLRWWSFSYVVVWALFALRDARRDASPEGAARRSTSDPQSP